MRLRSTPWHRRAVAVLLAVAVGALPACGLDANDEPTIIATDQLPADLVNPSTSTSTTSAQAPTATVLVYYLVQQDGAPHLIGVARDVVDPTRPRDRLSALLVPPTTEEQEAGILSSIPPDTVLLDTRVDGSELVVDLSRSLFDVQGQELRNAFAQLVWTATDLEGVRRVRFLVGGEEFRVPDEDGIERPGAVGRADYVTLAPLPG